MTANMKISPCEKFFLSIPDKHTKETEPRIICTAVDEIFSQVVIQFFFIQLTLDGAYSERTSVE